MENEIKVGDIVITDQLKNKAHLNNRPLRVTDVNDPLLRAIALIERDDDPERTFGTGKATSVSADRRKFRKI